MYQKVVSESTCWMRLEEFFKMLSENQQDLGTLHFVMNQCRFESTPHIRLPCGLQSCKFDILSVLAFSIFHLEPEDVCQHDNWGIHLAYFRHAQIITDIHRPMMNFQHGCCFRCKWLVEESLIQWQSQFCAWKPRRFIRILDWRVLMSIYVKINHSSAVKNSTPLVFPQLPIPAPKSLLWSPGVDGIDFLSICYPPTLQLLHLQWFDCHWPIETCRQGERICCKPFGIGAPPYAIWCPKFPMVISKKKHPTWSNMGGDDWFAKEDGHN